MSDNPNGTTPEQPVEPTPVDKSQEAEKIESMEVPTDVVPKAQYDELRSLSDRRYAQNLDQFANLARTNPELLKDMDGSTDDARKFRDSVIKRIYPQFSSYEQALDYINGVEDPKVQIDSRISDEELRLNAYLDAVSEFNEDYQIDSNRTKFKDEFRSYVTTLPYETRLQKTKAALGIGTSRSSISTPVSGPTPPVKAPEKDIKQEMDEDWAEYQRQRHLVS